MKFVKFLALPFINYIVLDRLPAVSETQFLFLKKIFFLEITVLACMGCYEVERKGK